MTFVPPPQMRSPDAMNDQEVRDLYDTAHDLWRLLGVVTKAAGGTLPIHPADYSDALREAPPLQVWVEDHPRRIVLRTA